MNLGLVSYFLGKNLLLVLQKIRSDRYIQIKYKKSVKNKAFCKFASSMDFFSANECVLKKLIGKF